MKNTLLLLLVFSLTFNIQAQRPRWYDFDQTAGTISGPNEFPTIAITAQKNRPKKQNMKTTIC